MRETGEDKMVAGTRTPTPICEDSGQSVVIVVLAMVLIFAVAGFAIDVGQWFVKHHQAQVSADAGALAAANCLAFQRCSSFVTSAGHDSYDKAVQYTNADGVPLASNGVSFNTNNKTVTVTTSAAAPVTFAGLFGIHPTATATATATWSRGTLPFSLYAENQTCGVGSASPHNPLGLYLSGTGGGGNTVYGLYANGEYYNSDNSNNTFFNGEVHTGCGTGLQTQGGCNGAPKTQNCWTNNSTVNMEASASLYPQCFPEPGLATTPSVVTSYCQTAPTTTGPSCSYPPDGYWTTKTTAPTRDRITTPGVYCIGSSGSGPATTFSGTCAASSGTPGTIYVDTSTTNSLTSSSGYEFVGPCVYVSTASSGTLSGPSGQPLVYGTTGATGSLPCTSCNNGSPDVIISAGGETFGSAVFDPLGTSEFTGNNGSFVGFVEAQNIIETQNNGIFGNGPNGTDEPDGDALIG